jgi:hypothetical protein
MRKSILLSLTLCLCIAMQAQNKSTVDADHNPSAQNSIKIEKDAQPLEYNRMIFGQFIEHFHRQITADLSPKRIFAVKLPIKHIDK